MQNNNKTKEAKASIVSTSNEVQKLTYEQALAGFLQFEECLLKMKELGDKVPSPRREEIKKHMKEPLPLGVYTSTQIFVILAKNIGGKLFLFQSEELTRPGRKGEAGETIRQHLCYYLNIKGVRECVEKYGFNSLFYEAVVKFHRESGEIERFLSFMESTACNASATSQAAKAEGHSLFVDGRELDVPTTVKGTRAREGKEESDLRGADV